MTFIAVFMIHLILQASCNGLPCGPLDWPLPNLAPLTSPTPPAQQLASPGDTATPAPTIEGLLVDLDDEQSLITDLIAATPSSIDGADGDYSGIVSNTFVFFSVVNAIRGLDLGILNPLFIAFFLISITTILLKTTTIFIPIIAVIVGMVRRIIQLIPFKFS